MFFGLGQDHSEANQNINDLHTQAEREREREKSVREWVS